jgi:hypothetical protein
MGTFPPSLGLVLLWLSLACCALSAALYLRLLTTHHEYWRRANSRSLARWVLFGRYVDVGDKWTIRMAQTLRAATVIFFVGAGIGFLMHAKV